MDLSVVIPVRDEAENISDLVTRLTGTLVDLRVSYEILFVTDINKDDTFELIRQIHNEDGRVKVIKLSNTYGQHTAVVCGLRYCSGDAVVIMDGDLQDYPEDIPKLYSKILEGYDIVYALKEKKNVSPFRNLFSKMFVRMMNMISDVRIEHNTSMFRIISRRTVEEILRFKERQPSLTFIMSYIGFKAIAVKVASGERKGGKTKYSYFRLLNFGITSLLSFSTKPIRLISIIGFCVAGLNFVYLCMTLIQKIFFDIGVLGWTTIISLITFIGGIQLFVIGIIGEYIAKIFMETKERPLYIVDQKVGDLK